MGTPLVIVESPAKARTISRFLGSDYQVEASIGHIRDLATRVSDLTPSQQKQPGAKLGVDTDNGFIPYYIVPKDKKAQVKALRKQLKDASALYLATDEDREGESISWHLLQVLKPEIPVYRLVFHEITVSAIKKALETPREVDESLVKAQEARRIVDRLFGYPVSELLWRKVGPNLSAGRVQSVAVRLVVDRERARMAHVSADWWDIRGPFIHGQGVVDAHLTQWKGSPIATGRNFNSDGKLKGKGLVVLGEAEAKAAVSALKSGTAKVAAVDERPYTDRPAPPFTTSTMQQEANRRFKWAARKTMNTAQRLYENGWITYMRTDSVALSQQAIAAARGLIESEYGAKYMPAEPRTYKGKAKNAQEAHEAIRPAGEEFRTLKEANASLDSDQRRLYELIWKRTVGCQMSDAKGRTITVRIDAGDGRFEAKGKTIDFAGYRLAYVAGSDDPEAAAMDAERILPPVVAGDTLDVGDLEAKGHATKPPPRLTEAALVKELEERGIGRPSTYASIIDTILRREYVFKKGSALVPTWTAVAVTRLLESEHFRWLVDYEFTAQMEDQLDDIAVGQGNRDAYLSKFWDSLKSSVEEGTATIDPRDVCTLSIGAVDDAATAKKLGVDSGTDVVVRVGKYGPFLQAGERTANLPDDLAPDELSLTKAIDLLSGPKILGQSEETGQDILLANGRFGWYVQLGDGEQEGKPRRKSVPRGIKPEQVDFELGSALLSLPREVGLHPESKNPIVADYGRYGPYVKSGDETRSIRDKNPMKVLELTVEEAVELLARPKGRKGAEILKEMGEDPKTKKAIKLMDGRYGPYVTDGDTNASLGKALSPDDLTLEAAIELIREREKAPKRKRPRRKKK